MRFAQQDPAEYVDGTNLYSYVRDHPLTSSDPQGLQTTVPTTQGVNSLSAKPANIFLGADGKGTNLKIFKDAPRFAYAILWNLANSTEKGGIIVQKVKIDYEIFDKATGNLPLLIPHFDEPCWEAWEVPPNKDAPKHFIQEYEDRLYVKGIPLEYDDMVAFTTSRPNSRGKVAFHLEANFYECALSDKFQVGKVVFAGPKLPSTGVDPDLKNPIGAPVTRTVTVTWNTLDGESPADVKIN